MRTQGKFEFEQIRADSDLHPYEMDTENVWGKNEGLGKSLNCFWALKATLL